MDASFDELRTLFQTDSVAAEQKAQEIMEEYIQSLEPEKRQRAQAYNWRIQQELKKFKDPVARMNRMVEMFWIGVNQFHETLQDPQVILDQQGKPSISQLFPKK